MPNSQAPTTVDEYLAGQPEERRASLRALRAAIRRALPRGYEEGIVYGMISYYVPLSRFPDTYNKKPLCALSLGAQRSHLALYLMGVYGNEAVASRFRQAWAKTGKRLDMGKACVRFKGVEDVALDAVELAVRSVTVDALIAQHDAAHRRPKAESRATSTSKGANSAAGTKAARAAKRAQAKTAKPSKPARAKRASA